MKRLVDYILKNKRSFIVNFGSLIEYFDFILFLYFFKNIQTSFFPHLDNAQIIISFAITYIARPIGGLLFGIIADKYNYKISIIYTTKIMGICSIIISILPEYSSIGIISTYTIILIRVLQGISMGAEIPCALAYNNKRYINLDDSKILPFYYATIGAIFAYIFFIIINKFFSHITNSWRYVFLFGGALSLSLSYFRSKIENNNLKYKMPLYKYINKRINIIFFIAALYSIVAFLLSITPIILHLSIYNFGYEAEKGYKYLAVSYLICLMTFPVWSKVFKLNSDIGLSIIVLLLIMQFICINYLIKNTALLYCYLFINQATVSGLLVYFHKIIFNVIPARFNATILGLGYNLGFAFGGILSLIGSIIIKVSLCEFSYYYFFNIIIIITFLAYLNLRQHHIHNRGLINILNGSKFS